MVDNLCKFVKKICLSLSSYSVGIIIWFIALDAMTWCHITFAFVASILFAISMLVLFKNSRDMLQVKSIQPLEANNIPTYIGLFVIMLGISDLDLPFQYVIVAFLFVLWIYMERNYYFNLIWLMLGYSYYKVEDGNGVVVTVITKEKSLKQKKKFTNLIRLNNFTFLQGKGEFDEETFRKN